jgi:hypothetical protein
MNYTLQFLIKIIRLQSIEHKNNFFFNITNFYSLHKTFFFIFLYL